MRKRVVKPNGKGEKPPKDGQTVIFNVREPVMLAPAASPPESSHSNHSKSAASDETALTAKNYRLAKELVRLQSLALNFARTWTREFMCVYVRRGAKLNDCLCCLSGCTPQSEVRIRHREESKNVTRLTMENVSCQTT